MHRRPRSSRKKHVAYILGDDGHPASKNTKAYVEDVYTVDANRAMLQTLDEPEERNKDGGLAGSCPPHNANLGPSVDLETEAAKDRI